MDKQKEIEEMAKYCCRACGIYSGDNKCSLGGDMTKCDISVNAATQLINAGYGNVKQAVKEFAERIKVDLTEVDLKSEEYWACAEIIDDLIKERYGEDDQGETS